MQRDKSSNVLLAIQSRIRTVLDLAANDTQLRILIDPDDDHPYFTSDGSFLYFANSRPDPRSGAGRGGFKNSRSLVVGVTTRTGVDPAGDDTAAAIKHLDLEDTIIDALMDFSTPSVAITCNWVGSEGPHRLKRHAQSIFRSTLQFDVTYALRLTPHATS